jgi:hypothetical protein
MPYLDGLREKEEALAGTPVKPAQACRVLKPVEYSRVLDCHQLSAFNPRTPAATSDLDAHDPAAATPAAGPPADLGGPA